jgi:ABC-type dipeptide/oligopeptide/nickel transport system ATPase component
LLLSEVEVVRMSELRFAIADEITSALDVSTQAAARRGAEARNENRRGG